MTVQRKLGEGGTAEVFLVARSGTARPQAVKVFLEKDVDALVEREWAVSGNMSFPGLVRTYEIGRTQCGAHYITMEYCPGATLDLLAGKLSEKQLLSVLSAVSVSLYVLHATGYVHNDLKPENIYLPESISQGGIPEQDLYYVKLADFSLARRYATTENHSVTGTVGYMSPEMILRETVLPASDLFSLGVMGYFLACGKMPFTSAENDPLEINAQITEGERPELCGPAAGYSQTTRDILHGLMAIDAARRPQTAFQLLEILSKAGSPYPYRRAVRPRHLIFNGEILDAGKLKERFGPRSFSDEQLAFIERRANFHPVAVRTILEASFAEGRFARLDGSWGWSRLATKELPWPEILQQISLRCIRGTSYSFKRLLFAFAIADKESCHQAILKAFDPDQQLAPQWNAIPENERGPLLYSLNLLLSIRTRRIIASRLCTLFEHDESQALLMGRLIYEAGEYERAIEQILKAKQTTNLEYARDEIVNLLELAEKVADDTGITTLKARVIFERAVVEKEVGNLKKAEEAFLSVVDLLAGNDSTQLAADALKKLGDIYKDTSDYDSGIRVLEQAREMYRRQGNQLGLSQTLNNLGNIYWIAGKMDRVLEHYEKALAIQRELNSEREIASSLSNIGSVHILKGEYDTGVKFLHESLGIKEKLGDKGEIARTWNNLGVTYLLMGDASEAIAATEKSLELNSQIGNKVEILLNYSNLAEASIQAGYFTNALNHLKESQALAQELGESAYQTDVSRLTGTMLRRMGNYDAAEAKLLEGLDIAERHDNKYNMLPCLIDLAKLHESLKDETQYLKYRKRASEIADELNDTQAKYYLALLDFQHGHNTEQYTLATKYLTELKTPRDGAILALTRLEYMLDIGQVDALHELADKAGQFFKDGIEDIDRSRYLLAVGRMYMDTGDMEKAKDYLNRATHLASQTRLLPEQWQASYYISELAYMAKDFESSFKHARTTITILKSIAANVKDTEKMQRLYSDKRIISLLGRIKSLQAVLGKKEGTTIAG